MWVPWSRQVLWYPGVPFPSAKWTAGTSRCTQVPSHACVLLLFCRLLGPALFARTVQYGIGAACAVGSRQGARKNKPRKSLNCAPCSVDTRLGRPAYHGRLSPAMREKRAESSPSLSAYSHRKLDPGVGMGMGCPCSSSPSPCSTLLWTVPYCARRQAPSKQNRTEQMSSPLRPIAPGQSRGRLGELWPMTSRTQLPIEVHPNQTERGTPAPQPQPASPLPLHQAGPPARLALSHPAQGHPQTPQSRSQPGSCRYMRSCSTRGTTAGSCPCGCSQDSTSSAVSARPAMASPSPIPFQPSPGPVWSLFLARSQGAIYGRSGWIDEGFFLARTPSPPYLGTSSLRLALGIISRDDDTGNLRVRKQLAQPRLAVNCHCQSNQSRVGRGEAISTRFCIAVTPIGLSCTSHPFPGAPTLWHHPPASECPMLQLCNT